MADDRENTKPIKDAIKQTKTDTASDSQNASVDDLETSKDDTSKVKGGRIIAQDVM